MVRQSRVPNLKSPAQVVLKISSIICQKLWGSRDLGHANLYGRLFVHPLGIPHPIQRHLPNL